MTFRTIKNIFVTAVLSISLSAHAATITVNSNADSVANDNNCTLREAIKAANTNAAVDSCTAGTGADTIVFASNIAGQTITLDGREMEISDTLTIDGGATGVTIDAKKKSRIFTVSQPLNIKNLTLTGGNAGAGRNDFGGAIYTTADVTVSNSTLSDNTAGAGGAIYANAKAENTAPASADVTVSNSTLSGNTAGAGGAIYANAYSDAKAKASANANVTVSNSTLSSNQATIYYGGAIVTLAYAENTAPSDASANVNVSNSTLSGNTSKTFGGAIHTFASFYANANVTVSSSTLSGNQATEQGGAISVTALSDANANVTVSNSTLSGNQAAKGGGAIFASADTIGKIKLNSSILLGNKQGQTANNCSFDYAVSVDATNSKNNLLDADCKKDNTGISANLASGTTWSQVLASYVDNGTTKPLIADNGCATPTATGCVKTIALERSEGTFTNPAINKGAANGTTADQRGFDYVGTPDIGAFEFGASRTLTITPTPKGTVTTNLINCGSKCKAIYGLNTIVKLTATPKTANYGFEKWTGDCTGNKNPLSVKMDANKTCAATFTKNAQGDKRTKTLTGVDGVSKGKITLAGGGKNCSLSTARIAKLSELVGSPTAPAGLGFAQGLVKFSASDCDVGATVKVTITYPKNIASGAKLMKWGKTKTNRNNHWYQLPATISGKTVIYSITDGGLGDNDLTPDGNITDPAGPASSVTTPATAHPVPALSPAWLLLMMSMLGAFGYRQRRRN